ncbi:MAG: hypothetical protein DI498_11720 [Paracoccus denitrificans]|nr:MAG: hypothetical protein DI498_11720 [Paracoccus denitrificans]PZO83411.1 MAG: hypothetical protein DI633_11720 [Paracoccus denitrificans]
MTGGHNRKAPAMTKQAATKFALSFSPDAVHLLDRDATGAQANDTGNAAAGAWHERGQARFDASDFRTEIKRLRDIARAAQGDDAPVALVIPEEQILYTTVDVDSGDSQRVGQALNGLTPYAVDDLAWDWQKLATGVRVAAVARQTLSEAEEFARRHGFSPSSFIADPANGQFPGTPEFRTDAPEAVAEDGLASVVATAAEDEAADPGESIAEDKEAAASEDTHTANKAEVAETAAPAEAADVSVDTAKDMSVLAEDVQTDAKPADSAEAAGKEAPQEPVLTAPVEAVSSDQSPAETPAADAQTPAETTTDAAKTAEPSAATPAVTGVISPVIALAGDAAPGRVDAKPEEPVAEAPAKTEAEVPIPAGEVTAEPKAPVLPDRARAVLERAAQARAIRPDPMPADDRRVGERGGIGALVAMLGALVVALALIWGLGPARQTSVIADTPVAPEPQIADTPDDVAPVTASAGDAAPSAPAVTTVQADPAPVEVAQAPTTEAPSDAATVVPNAAAPSPVDPSAPVVTAAGADTGTPNAVEPATTAPAAPAQISADVARALVQGVSGAARAVVSQPAAPTATATATPPQTSGNAGGVSAPPARPAQQARSAPPASTQSSSPPPASQAAAINQAVRQAAPTSGSAVQRSQRPALRRSAPAQPASAPAEAAPRANATAVSRQGTRPNRRPAEGRSAETRSSAPAATTAPAATSTPRARPTRKPVEGASLSVMSRIQVAQLSEGGLISQSVISDYRAQSGFVQMAFLPARDPMAPRFADARPSKRPAGKKTATDAIDSAAIEAAVKSADQPAKKSTAKAVVKPKASATASAAPAGDRPKNRPTGKGASQTASTPAATAKAASRSASTAPSQRPAHASAVESAIADAVKESSASPGAVALTSLRSSDIPVARPQRSGKASAPAIDDDAQKIALAAASRPTTQIPSPIPTTPAVPAAPAATAAAPAAPVAEPSSDGIGAASEAKAAADLQREAQERAAAEARARAQAAAEEAAAKARNEVYRPPEVDDEPDVRTTSARGQTSGVVAKNATVGGIDTNATQVIGVIGAGRASRGLIRLRNGKVVTVRLGDRIDGGAITSIGKGRINYAKGGRQYSLPMLNGN